jgi:hypothetical protein
VPASLLAHAIATGGFIDAPDPILTTVTLDSTGATFLLVIYTADAEHGNGDPLTDSQGNAWTKVPDFPSAGSGHTTGTASLSIYWTGSPLTSATHTVSFNCGSAGHGHAALAVSAWAGMSLVAFGPQAWVHNVPAGPLTVTGLAVSAAMLGFGDASAPATATLHGGEGWTLVDSQGMQPFVAPPFGWNGLSVASQLLSASSSVTATWDRGSAPDLGVSIVGFTYTAPTPPTPPPSVTYKTRRLKRFALPWDEANRWKFISRLEFILQTGIGDATGSNPVLMVRLSGDGGMTWGNEIDLTVGQMGAFSTRAYVHRLGRARNPVIEVTMTDAADWQLVQALVDLDSGTS